MDEIISNNSKQLVQFREHLSDLQLDDYQKSDGYLIKWLMHTGYDLKKAETLLRVSIKWREQNKIDGIMEEQFPEMTKLMPFKYLGHDKSGRPLMEIPFGLWKVREAVDLNRDQALRYLFQFSESTNAALKRIFNQTASAGSHSPNVVNQFTAILDCKNVTFSQFGSPKAMKLMIDLIKMEEANSPNVSYKLVMLNVHRAVRILIKMISPLLSAANYSALNMLGSNPEEWKEELLKLVDVDVLPVRYGGTNTAN